METSTVYFSTKIYKNLSKKFKKYTNKCLIFVKKGYIIGVR